MALTVTMPQLGESVTEGTIARWLKQPGDAVAKYESIAEVITDKVNAEIPAPADGVMSELIAPEGTVVPVGQPICSIETGVASAEPEAQETAAVAAPAAQSAQAAPAEPVTAPAEPQAGGETAVAPIQDAFTESVSGPGSGVRWGFQRERAGRGIPRDPGGADARARTRGRPLPDHRQRDRGADLKEGRS